ncbi:MAG: hypothetical protein K9J74_00505 [Sulfuritalea sp.]|nr:hypothetical protein [Sulfuritalea sp.]
MNRFVQVLEVSLVFMLSIILLAPRWLGYISTSSALNQLDTDFLYFDVIYRNSADYSNVLVANVVERVHESFGVIIGFSKFLSDLGIDQSFQLIGFFYVQVFLGVMGISYIARGLALSIGERALVFAFFLFSYFTQFGRYIGGPGFYNKVTASCLAMGFGYVIIGLFINGRYRLSISASALLGYVHPVYSAVFLALNGLYGAKAFLLDRRWSVKYAVTFALLPGMILTPLIYELYGSSEIVMGSISSLWWDYLKAKTSNPFPLQDGLVIVIPTLLVFFIAHHLLGRMSTAEADGPYRRAQWVLGGVIAAWLVQILFTEVIPVSFIARLSLTRTSPFGLLFVVIAYMGIVWRNRYRDETGLWMILLIVPAILGTTQLIPGEAVRNLFVGFPWVLIILGGYWPDFAIFPDILLMFLLLGVFAIHVGVVAPLVWLRGRIEPKAVVGKNLVIGAAGLLAIVVLLEVSMLNKNWSMRTAASLVSGIFLLMWLAERLVPRLKVYREVSALARERSTTLLMALVMAIVLPHAITTTKTLLAPALVETEADLMWNYIEQNTMKNEMVLIVPFFDTRRYPVMPLRPVFIDWGDAQYVLYDPQMLTPVMERLSLIGMNLDKALRAENCRGVMQYVDAMCRRKLFESLAEDYSDTWRGNLSRMREIAPNLTYVLLRSKYVLPTDRVIYTSGSVSLIKI